MSLSSTARDSTNAYNARKRNAALLVPATQRGPRHQECVIRAITRLLSHPAQAQVRCLMGYGGEQEAGKRTKDGTSPYSLLSPIPPDLSFVGKQPKRSLRSEDPRLSSMKVLSTYGDLEREAIYLAKHFPPLLVLAYYKSTRPTRGSHAPVPCLREAHVGKESSTLPRLHNETDTEQHFVVCGLESRIFSPPN
jgi:hypothetical protein